MGGVGLREREKQDWTLEKLNWNAVSRDAQYFPSALHGVDHFEGVTPVELRGPGLCYPSSISKWIPATYRKGIIL